MREALRTEKNVKDWKKYWGLDGALSTASKTERSIKWRKKRLKKIFNDKISIKHKKKKIPLEYPNHGWPPVKVSPSNNIQIECRMFSKHILSNNQKTKLNRREHNLICKYSTFDARHDVHHWWICLNQEIEFHELQIIELLTIRTISI